jgi:DNA-binding MarR family transcriptional regulator
MKKKQAARAPAPAPARRAQASLGPLRSFIGFQLRRAQDASFDAFARRVGQANLRPGHFAVLAVIGANRGLNQTALSHATGRDKSTLTPAIKSLLKRKLVARARSKSDSRAWQLALTAAGRKYLDKLMAHAQTHDRRLDEIVGDAHKALLIQLLERIVAELEADS